VARDGTPVRSSRSAGAVGPAFTLLVAFAAVMAISRRRQAVAKGRAPEPAVESPQCGEPTTLATDIEPRGRNGRGLPRFFTGAFTGIVTGIALGAIAVALVTMSDAEARAGVIVGTGLMAPPPTYDGIISARILSQEMNPLLIYADEDVAAQYAPTSPDPAPAPVVSSPVERHLDENAGIIFGVLASLTVASWSLIMRGLISHPAVANAGVE